MRFSSARQPRARLLVAGVPVAGVVEVAVRATGDFSADRFRVALALGAAAAPWAAGDEIDCEIAVSLDGGAGWVGLIEGLADRVEIDPIAGLMWLDGRDRAAGLIEARGRETFANRTASEIATLLAGRHGLAADVQATTTLVGRYWQRDHDRLMLDQFAAAVTEWDLLALLAAHEGFDLWVSGRTLHFRAAPPAAVAPPVLAVADLAALRLERALTFAQAIEVVVKSWNARQQLAFTASATSAGRGGRAALSYVYVEPNLTPAAAQALADRRLGELQRHELVLNAELPGELKLAPRMLVALAGAPEGFGGLWRIDEVERRLSADGFVQSLSARKAEG